MIQEPTLKPKTEAKLEAHRKYIDIQFVISGEETMGWSPVQGCGNDLGFNKAKDCGFFGDVPMAWFPVRPAHLRSLPHDAHAPASVGTARKVVVKILA